MGAWLRDHRDRPEAREGRGRPRVGAGGGALVRRAHRAEEEGAHQGAQLAAKAAARKAKKTRQKARRAKEAGERAASEAERAEAPRAQLRENIQYVMAGLRTAAAQTRNQAGSNIGVEYSLPPERDDGYRRGPSKVYATVPQGTVATTVASDWLANELAEHGEIDAAYRDRIVMHLMTAAGASVGAGRRRVQVHGWRGNADRGRRRGRRPLRGLWAGAGAPEGVHAGGRWGPMARR